MNIPRQLTAKQIKKIEDLQLQLALVESSFAVYAKSYRETAARLTSRLTDQQVEEISIELAMNQSIMDQYREQYLQLVQDIKNVLSPHKEEEEEKTKARPPVKSKTQELAEYKRSFKCEGYDESNRTTTGYIYEYNNGRMSLLGKSTKPPHEPDKGEIVYIPERASVVTMTGNNKDPYKDEVEAKLLEHPHPTLGG